MEIGVRHAQGAREILVALGLAAAGLVLAAAAVLGPHIAQDRHADVSVVDVTRPATAPRPLP